MDFDKYENKFKMPGPVATVCDNCGAKYSKAGKVVNFCSHCGTNVKEQYETKCKIRREAVEKYNKEQVRLDELFKNDALEYTGLSDHPKKDIIFGKAYMDGHSGGYHEVLGELDDLAVFVHDLEL